MDDQKRSLLAIALIIGFIYIWFEYFVPKPAPQSKPAAPQPERVVSSEAPTPPTASITPAPSVGMETSKALPAEKKTRETPLAKMVWTNRAGALETLSLKEYAVEQKSDSPRVKVVPFRGGGSPPVEWSIRSNQALHEDGSAVYQFERGDEMQVAFRRKTPEGLNIRKTYRWTEDNYSIEHVLEIENQGAQTQQLQLSAHIESNGKGGKARGLFNPGDPFHVVAFVNEKAVRLEPKEVLENEEIPKGDIAWAGFDSRYFLLTAKPEEGRWSEVVATGTPSKEDPEQPDTLALAMKYLPREVKSGEKLRLKISLFAGPKDIGLLRSAGSTLDRAIDLGDWLGPIARPILLFLRWLHSHIPNYGVAIILLTVLVRLLMFPLTQMQARSMKKMQEHKPQLDALREKYADDKERYQREMMTYMRTHKVNPMGGCLLILPQMPIFFALYRVLYNSIELRHAPFVGWIHDLSEHDPYFILPVLLGVVMFLQQQLTPTPGADPAQQKIMKLMPVMFAGLMVMLPAGLNLYIFVSTLWGIVQQWLIQRKATPTIGSKPKMTASA